MSDATEMCVGDDVLVVYGWPTTKSNEYVISYGQ